MNGQGAITSGELDVNDTGSVLQDIALTGTYTVSSNGRGTLTLTSNAYSTQNFVFYVVNATDLKLVESDALSSTTPFTSGDVLTMAASPFNLASFNGRYAFTLGGADFNGVATGSGGVFTSDGNGNLNGVLDDNDGGGLTLSQPFNGTYTMSSTGRASLTFAFFNLAAYPAANGSAELVELDANGVSAGMAKAQANTSFSTASVSGMYAMNWAGTLNPAPSVLTFPSEEDITGQLTADGAGNLGGTLDVNSVSNILQGLPVSQSNYSMTGNGHGGATINTQVATFNMQLYQVDANTVLFVDTDPNRVMVGLMQKQQ